MARHNDFGRRGEEAAIRLLEAKGYRLLECNWTYNDKEIDLIVQKAHDLVIVEVKTRRHGSSHSAQRAMDEKKVANLVLAGGAYMRLKRIDALNPRFDLITVEEYNDGHLELIHYENAFHPPLKSNSLNRSARKTRRPF